MGFYIRKAIKVGPFRFNLSKSGVGVSAGVKGLRLGTGPRGNYVHIGRGGLYYRKTLPSVNGRNGQPMTEPQQQPSTPGIDFDPLNAIDSGELGQMVDSSSADLVEEINAKHRKIRRWPLVAAIGFLIVFAVLQKTQSPLAVTIAAMMLIALTLYTFVKDNIRKTTVLLFDLETDIQHAYQNLHGAFERLSNCIGKWHIEAQGAVIDKKRNAGATSIIRRTPIAIGIGCPPKLRTNVTAPVIPVGRQSLYFFPDRVLVFESNRVGAMSYKNMIVSVEATRFIEEGSVPEDAKVVDSTWRYVNKRGGPDKRFTNNRELPIALYEDISFRSDTGLNELIQVSRVGVGDDLARCIHDLATRT
ncbi:MAG: DUF4236 domain-containing protein [Phycisphaerales bacterium]|nr:DUF4236 domain-containing protein [Phycisphaerales bacterium]MCB9857983.1 DUF4236 domain-containing protein [Phycisphaerales bacterium]MCB9864924.1 DUF4236 domain-containing protein [Phycisphaerales bacterium]